MFIRIRGRETGEGEGFSAAPECLYFTDDTYTRFKGVVGLPWVGDNIDFEGWKVDARPQKEPEAWTDAWRYE